MPQALYRLFCIPSVISQRLQNQHTRTGILKRHERTACASCSTSCLISETRFLKAKSAFRRFDCLPPFASSCETINNHSNGFREQRTHLRGKLKLNVHSLHKAKWKQEIKWTTASGYRQRCITRAPYRAAQKRKEEQHQRIGHNWTGQEILKCTTRRAQPKHTCGQRGRDLHTNVKGPFHHTKTKQHHALESQLEVSHCDADATRLPRPLNAFIRNTPQWRENAQPRIDHEEMRKSPWIIHMLVDAFMPSQTCTANEQQSQAPT